MNDNYELSADILCGADQIADFMFGDPKERRRVYHLCEKGGLPVFKLGALIAARRTVLLAWIADQEQAAAATRAA
jgi:hypothetical protein